MLVSAKAVRFFCAYAPDDAALVARFEMHLALLQREGSILARAGNCSRFGEEPSN